MHINRAVKRVRSLIRGGLERYHGSPTISYIFASETELCLQHLREQFATASNHSEAHTIWPKMILKYLPDEDDMPIPVMCPIKDDRGYYLGIRVISKQVENRPKRTNAYLEWCAPD